MLKLYIRILVICGIFLICFGFIAPYIISSTYSAIWEMIVIYEIVGTLCCLLAFFIKKASNRNN